MTPPRSCSGALALAILAPWGSSAQHEELAGKPRATPTRLAEGDRIEIDGILDEAAWLSAAELGALTQVQPTEGAPPSQPTVVRLAYDKDFLYIAIECREDPDKVFARQMTRDAFVRFDDVVELWVDTFADQRFAFWFQITAGGSRGDALLSDHGSNFNKQWDGIWYGRSRITAEGWQAEIALPFKTLSFDGNSSTWGFNLRRERKFNGEEHRWASPRVAYRFFNLAEGGLLTGLTGLEHGLGLDITPYGKATLAGDADENEVGLLGEVGFDIGYRITPSVNLRVTQNTDFAETEVDERQINLDRFPLFFPEKRDFFLEDASAFQFGPPDRQRQLLPFFSRTVGRDDNGEAVSILAGAKVTGRIGPWSIGALGTWIDEQKDASDDLLGVLRVSRNFGTESSVGIIATGGRPNEAGSAATQGIDFRLGDSRFFGPGKAARLWGYALGTQQSGTDGDDTAFGFETQVRTKHWRHELAHHTIGGDFEPALGFVRRQDSREYRASSEYTWRNESGGWWRRASMQLGPRLFTTTSGDLETVRVPWTWLDLVFDSEDSIEIRTEFLRESVAEDFEVGQGIDVTAEDYDMVRHEIELQANDRRIVGGEIEAEFGEFFDGELARFTVNPIFVPNKHVQIDASYSEFHVDVPQGDFVTRLVAAGFDFAFSPEVSWRNFVQWDNDSDDLGVQTRLRWILSPGREFFVVGLFGWQETQSGGLIPTDQDLTFKISYTLRF